MSDDSENNIENPEEEPNENGFEANGLTRLEQEILSADPHVFEGIPEEKKMALLKSISISITYKRSHSGPLPPADELVKYNHVIPDGANRIMNMAERQQEHRISIEKVVMANNNKQSGRGQIYAFVIAIIALTISGFLAYFNKTEVACVIGGTTILGLVTTFIIGKNKQ